VRSPRLHACAASQKKGEDSDLEANTQRAREGNSELHFCSASSLLAEFYAACVLRIRISEFQDGILPYRSLLWWRPGIVDALVIKVLIHTNQMSISPTGHSSSCNLRHENVNLNTQSMCLYGSSALSLKISFSFVFFLLFLFLLLFFFHSFISERASWQQS
jgi:hypothetical protein